ncbi:MAG: hypothetical protein J0L63_05915 [Anaerolineae bacterium]|nr:hypothetical protein [Anaerolineae bacterium]
MENLIKNGMDSGQVAENVKRQLFTDQLGICAMPSCSERIMQDRTTLGECAHIIPRTVGKSREDYVTPLEDRKKYENLLYLCEKHHKIVDNPLYANLYTAELLRDWKKQHEEWAARIKKTPDQSYSPPEFRAMLADLERQVAEQANFSGTIIGKLLENCRELLDRQFISEATVILNQIDLLLLDAGNRELSVKADLLGTILLIRNEQIPEAKKRLLQLIQANPHDVAAMVEYVELCDNVPEPDDDLERIEELARHLSSDHPRLLLIDLNRKLKRGELVEIQDISENWADDKRLNARFICLYALFCDLDQKSGQRDALINRWESELPDSPRPHLFRVLFRTLDLLRSPAMSLSEKIREVQEVIKYSKEERDKSVGKDPLDLRGQISWLMQDIKQHIIYAGLSSDVDDRDVFLNNFIDLIGKCYFDKFINDILIEILSSLRIESDQWKVITRKIQASGVLPSQLLVELLFLYALHPKDLYTDLDEFVTRYGYSDLSSILQAIKNDNAEETAKHVNAKKAPLFALDLLHSLASHEISVRLVELLESNDTHEVEWLYARLRVFDLNRKETQALEILRKLPLERASLFTLNTIERIAYRNKQWELFIPIATQLLNFDIPEFYKSQLHAELAMAYSERGDDTNAIKFADLALSQASELGVEKSQILLHVLAESLARKGQYDEACEKFQQYEHVTRSFSLLLEEADLYLKSTFIDKYEKAIALVVKAFEETEVYSDELYVSAALLLIELSNSGQIPNQDEPVIEDGLFLKLDGFPNWFYVGEGKGLGAEPIQPKTPNYNAIIHRALHDYIEWPADRYSNPNTKRKILQIVTAPAFLSHRANEGMALIAQIGNQPIWSFQVMREDGSLNLENLHQFFKERFQDTNEFFDNYVSAPLPFSFLCAMEGDLAKALGRISSEQKGFIRFNDGTPADINTQKATAKDALRGATSFIDGLAALMLIEADLLETVIKALPNLGVSTSIIGMLRRLAVSIENISGSVGRGGFVDGIFQFRARDKDAEEAFRKRLLASADLLDTLPNKVIGKTYTKSTQEKDLDSVLPVYFVDAFRYSQENNALILTDDAFLVQAYHSVGVSPLPKHFSSYSLIRAMTEEDLLTRDDYLRYFARLSHYRYHLLPISSDDMFQVVLPPMPSGLVTSAPRNISFLNLQLTLAQEYGVDDKTASGILASFFLKLILNDSVPAEIAEEIFALTIVQGLTRREKRIVAKVIMQMCQQNLRNIPFVSQRSWAKLTILDRQISGFAQGIDPIVIQSPTFLRNTHPTNYDSTD